MLHKRRRTPAPNAGSVETRDRYYRAPHFRPGDGLTYCRIGDAPVNVWPDSVVDYWLTMINTGGWRNLPADKLLELCACFADSGIYTNDQRVEILRWSFARREREHVAAFGRCSPGCSVGNLYATPNGSVHCRRTCAPCPLNTPSFVAALRLFDWYDQTNAAARSLIGKTKKGKP